MTGRKRALADRTSELLALYRSGMDMKSIAKFFGVATSTVGLELDRLGARKQIRYEDIVYGFAKMKEHPDFSFVLGMIWGVGSYLGGGKFVIRHKKRQVIERIYSVLKTAYIPEPFTSKKGSHFIQFGNTHPLLKFLFEAGWVGRKSEGREMPKCEMVIEDFVRGYVFVHHSLTWSTNKRRKKPYLRLRIFGPPSIIENISTNLSAWTGVGQKNPHRHSNTKKMVTIEYSISEEVEVLCRFLGLEIPGHKTAPTN